MFAATLIFSLGLSQKPGQILDTPPDGIVRIFRSPDHRYAAVMSTQEGSCPHMRVKDLKRNRYLAEYDDVSNFVWLPGKPHSLLVATDQMYGEGILSIWNGHARTLRKTYPNDGDTFLEIVRLNLAHNKALICENAYSWMSDDGHQIHKPDYYWVSLFPRKKQTRR